MTTRRRSALRLSSLVLILLATASPMHAQTHSVTSCLCADSGEDCEPLRECPTSPPRQGAASKDRVCLQQETRSIVMNIYHATGIGSTQLNRPQTGWPAIVSVRLHHFPELEGFSARSSAATFTCEQSRPDGIPARLDCRLADVPIDAIERKPEFIEILLPQVLLGGDGPVEIHWVDQWR